MHSFSPPWNPLIHTTRPFINITFALNYVIHGKDVWGYHLVNLIIHLSAALLAFGIIRRTLDRPRFNGVYNNQSFYLAAVCSLLWMAHPLQTQSVTYIAQRMESLGGLFYLLMLYAFIRREDNLSQRSLWSCVCIAAGALGIASKETLVTAPLVLILFDRLFFNSSFKDIFKKNGKFHLAVMIATWGILLVIYYFCYGWIKQHLTHLDYISPLRYALTETGVILHYIKMIFWPYPLVLDYYWPFVKDFREAFFPATTIICILGGTIWLFKKNSSSAFLGIWFFAILLPTSSFLRISDPVFDHRVYLPLLSVTIPVVLFFNWTVDRFISNNQTRFTIKAGVFLIVFGMLAAASFERNKVFQNPLSLWEDVVKKQPWNARGHLNLGMAMVERGQINQETVFHFEESLRLKEKNAEAHNNLGNIFDLIGEYEKAVYHYKQALELSDDHPVAHSNLAGALLHQGKIDEAIRHYTQAIRVDPEFAAAYNNLGNALRQKGDDKSAEYFFREAIRIKPDFAFAYNNLANLLADQGKFDEAVVNYQQAIAIMPNYTRAKNNLEELIKRAVVENAHQLR